MSSIEKHSDQSSEHYAEKQGSAISFAFPVEPSERPKSVEHNTQSDFSFDVDTSTQSNKANLFAAVPTPPASGRDIVNTEWDIPKISFPSEEEVLKTTNEDGTAKVDAAATKTTLPLFPVDQPRSQVAMNANAVAQAFDFNSIIQGTSQAEEAKAGSHKMDDSTARRSRKAIAISAVAVVAVAAMAFGGVNMVRRHNDTVEFRSAMKTCTAANTAYSKAYAKLGSLLLNTKTEQGITADQVADAATVKDLQSAVSAANRIGVAEGCESSLSPATLKSRAKETAELTAALKKSATAVPDAAEAVSASKGVKDVAIAAGIKQNLQSAVTDAQTLLDNSLYAVADNQTRVSLEEAIDSANDVLKAADAAEASGASSSADGSSSKSASDSSSTQPTLDVSAMQAALTALQQASNAVTSSMNDLIVQNQLAAQNSTQAYTYGYANTGTGSGATSGSGSTSGDTTGTGSSDGSTTDNGSSSPTDGNGDSSGSGSDNTGSGDSSGDTGSGDSSGDTGSGDGSGSGADGD